MTKFSKRLKKANKRARNVLVLGTGLNNLEDLLETFNTVFVVNGPHPRIQKRNAVYRETFENIHAITDIDFIIIDLDQEKFIPELSQVWRRTAPIIIIQGPDLIAKEYQKILKADHYEIREVAKGYYVWKNKI
jgi:hypothetical protein